MDTLLRWLQHRNIWIGTIFQRDSVLGSSAIILTEQPTLVYFHRDSHVSFQLHGGEWKVTPRIISEYRIPLQGEEFLKR